MKNKLEPCKICDTKTRSVFNINFTATPICDRCADTIFLQQAEWLIKTKSKK